MASFSDSLKPSIRLDAVTKLDALLSKRIPRATYELSLGLPKPLPSQRRKE